MPASLKFTDDELQRSLARGQASTGELAEIFQVTRQAVLTRLKRLKDQGLVEQIGAGPAARWRMSADRSFSWLLEPGADEDAMWRDVWEQCGALVTGVNDATRSVLRYVATEMLNNAIDHSEGTKVHLQVSVVAGDVSLRISDDGVGAFPHVQRHFRLPTPADAAAHVAKGRQTTAPEAHSGQGLFFSSKAVDSFEVSSAGLAWRVDNKLGDEGLFQVKELPGTQVLVRTAMDGQRTLKEVFDRFSDPEDLDFDRSRYRVSLAPIGHEIMSRSEAKRIGAGLEAYRTVELDFTGVEGVGQGFVDELFRVWGSAHPDTELVVTNANDAVQFMIRRGMPGSRGPGDHDEGRV